MGEQQVDNAMSKSISDRGFDDDMEELNSAEAFLSYFAIDFDPEIVQVNRLHILQRFHNYLRKTQEMPEEDAARRLIYKDLLTTAYSDFIDSDARTEKVFRVFHMGEPSVVTIPLSELNLKGTSRAPQI